MTSSAPNGESGSNWLDRFRPTDHTPTADNLNFSVSDHTHAAASGRPDCDSTHSDRQGRDSVETLSGMGDRQWTNKMSNVLRELFYTGGLTHNSKLSRRKCPRKQRNPKPFIASSSDDNVKEKSANLVRKDENVPAPNSFNDGVVDAKEESFDVGHPEEHEDKERADNELVGYSKCEVTVIDTSCPDWKLEKLVFRKSNVWKVRDRKGKSKIFGKKKRKGSFGYDKNGGGKKKAKFSEFEQNKGTSSQNVVSGSAETNF